MPPSPEEFQRRLQEILRSQMRHPEPGRVEATPDDGGIGETGSPSREREDAVLRFDRKPREVKAHLDRFVIRQDEAKKVLSVALCDHYHAVRRAREGQVSGHYVKQNILLLGPTGVGKTYLIRSIAELIGVPFVKADATKFSETGYVGGDVEDLVRDLLRRADGDVSQAEYGIIYLDEVDKLAAATGATGRDVSGRGVQTNLLKLMEETEVPARAPHDIAGQLQALMEMGQGRGRKQAATINTRHILFVMSGAFGGLEPIIRRRLQESTIGFAATSTRAAGEADLLREAQTKDFMDFGFEPEFVGRLPVRVVCHPLEVDDLFSILKNAEGSIIRQYEEAFEAYGVQVSFQDEALRRIAALAVEEKTGARGLMTVCERVLREFKFELPSTSVRRLAVTQELVDRPGVALGELLAAEAQVRQQSARDSLREYTQAFQADHGLKLEFTDAAAARLLEMAAELGRPSPELCAERFKDYQFGLRLIAQNTGRREFVLDVDGVENPDRVLSEWVVASYREGK